MRVTHGGSKTFTVTPDTDHRIVDILVDGESVGVVSKYTFENVRERHTIEAIFEKIPTVADPEGTDVFKWLNTADHIQYLHGYPDNLFGPDDNMTRAEVAQMFYNLLLEQEVPVTVHFDDVPDTAWYSKAVNTLGSLGIVAGIGDGQYAPERPITRAEFTVIAMRFAKLPEGGTNIFSDVVEHAWYYDYVIGSIQYGWITGYPDGTFRPENTITRAEVTTIVNRMLDRSADKSFVDRHGDRLNQFFDVSKSYWAYYQIMEAANAHHCTKNGLEEIWKD